MPHVSKIKLKKSVASDIGNTFASTLLEIRGVRGRAFLIELLTPTERIMLSKRLSIILMLSQNASYYRIRNMLRVSTSTIKRVHTAMLSGSFSEILRRTAEKKSRREFWNLIEAIARGGLPPRGARWSRPKNTGL